MNLIEELVKVESESAFCDNSCTEGIHCEICVENYIRQVVEKWLDSVEIVYDEQPEIIKMLKASLKDGE